MDRGPWEVRGGLHKLRLEGTEIKKKKVPELQGHGAGLHFPPWHVFCLSSSHLNGRLFLIQDPEFIAL